MTIPTEAIVQKAMLKLSPEDRLIFEQTYNRKAKSSSTGYLLWFFLGWHYAYLGQWGMQVLYWVSFAGLGIWALVDLFRMNSLVDNANRDIAIQTLRDLRLAAD